MLYALGCAEISGGCSSSDKSCQWIQELAWSHSKASRQCRATVEMCLCFPLQNLHHTSSRLYSANWFCVFIWLSILCMYPQLLSPPLSRHGDTNMCFQMIIAFLLQLRLLLYKNTKALCFSWLSPTSGQISLFQPPRSWDCRRLQHICTSSRPFQELSITFQRMKRLISSCCPMFCVWTDNSAWTESRKYVG